MAVEGVDPTLGFRGRDPLHPMHSRFKFQLAVDAVATHRQDQFAKPAQVGLGAADGLHSPAHFLAVTLIHPCQITGPETGFVAACAGTNFQHHTALIAGIPRQQSQGEPLRQRCVLFLEAGQLILRQFLNRSVTATVFQQLTCGITLGFEPLEFLEVEH